MTRAVVCADVGSTFTKAALVDLTSGALIATASHRTTVDTDVLDGLAAVRGSLTELSAVAAEAEVLVCSSAGGGLRLAVVGYERVVTAEAGHRVGLSAGARVVHVTAGPLDDVAVDGLLDVRPDVVLLVGGTDGGNAEVLEHNARALAGSALRCPIVVAGNAAAREQVSDCLATGGKTVIGTANVLPRIGFLDPQPAREAIRDVFIRHVIGGKGLSRRGSEFADLVRAATPDAVLAGVELLADGVARSGVEAVAGAGADGVAGAGADGVAGAGDVLVIDVGGATTDVYSVVTPDPEEATLRREVVEVAWRDRTVEGDLGVRWSAPGVLTAAISERLITNAEAAELVPAVERRAAEPGLLDDDDAVDERLAGLAATVAARRHARPQPDVNLLGGAPAAGGVRPVRRGGRDLRAVRLVVGSGGVLRHAPADGGTRVLRAVVSDTGGGWQVPERAALVVDRSYVLAAAGLLALTGRAPVGARLLRSHLR